MRTTLNQQKANVLRAGAGVEPSFLSSGFGADAPPKRLEVEPPKRFGVVVEAVRAFND